MVGVKYVVGIYVPDFPYRVAHDFFVVEHGFRSYFTRDYNTVALDERFAGDAAELILFEACVENAVGNIIGNFVGVTFAHRLR